jgi:hypothetical protein
MKSKLSLYVELAGVAAMIVGFILGAHHLRVELPLLFGAAAILISHYVLK